MNLIQSRNAVVLGVLAQASFLACGAPLSYGCTYLVDPGRGYSWPNSINEKGTVVGYAAIDWPGTSAAVVWKEGKAPVILPTIGRARGEANDINDRGQVAGSDTSTGDDHHAVWWRHGEVEILANPPGSRGFAVATALNNRGVVVGAIPSLDRLTPHHAAVWHGDRVVDLGTLGNRNGQSVRWSMAMDINDHGVIVGESQVYRRPGRGTHAVRWDGFKTIVDLGTLPGGRDSIALKVNNPGTIIGYSEFAGGANNQFHATAWLGGVVRDLGTLPVHDSSFAFGLNDLGVVVGMSGNSPESERRAVVWYTLDEPPTDLNTRVDAAGCMDLQGRVYALLRADSINSNGQIAAAGMSADGLIHASFKLTPR